MLLSRRDLKTSWCWYLGALEGARGRRDAARVVALLAVYRVVVERVGGAVAPTVLGVSTKFECHLVDSAGP